MSCYNDFIYIKQMTYTPEQISQIVLKVLKEIEEPNVLKLSYEEKFQLAQHPNTSKETLEVLATDKEYYVRFGLHDTQIHHKKP